MRKLFLGFMLCVLASQLSAQPRVPSTFMFCGIEVTLSRGARERIQSHVNKIYENPVYLKRMVARAKMYFPYIEEAFRDVRVPPDLKYLSIQESALKPNAVSMSNAVGFWQFKEGSAKETGLIVDRYVDERKHIYRASIGSAKYFARANGDFNNWLYAIISYYEGPTGAVPFTDPAYYGRKKMTINDDFHWYALKAIAHKIAYQPALEEDVNVNYYLMPFATNGHRTWREVIEAHNLSEDSFFEYNKWINDTRRIPDGRDFTYYIPVPVAQYLGHVEDPGKQLKIAMTSAEAQLLPSSDLNVLSGQPEPDTSTLPQASQSQHEEIQLTPPAKSQTSEKYPGASFVAQPVTQLPREAYAIFNIEDDLHHQSVYTVYDGINSFERFSGQHLIFSDKLLKWNRLEHTSQLDPPQVIYLGPLSNAQFHVVEKGETLPNIARKHDVSVGKILRKNRMDKDDMTIYIGQKLYLQKKKPKGEKLIILRITPQEEESEMVAEETPYTESATYPQKDTANVYTVAQEESSYTGFQQEEEVIHEMPKPSRPPIQEFTSRWIEHTVLQGETLWSISKRYRTKVDIIKRINQMDTTDLYIGQVLRIMANEEVVRGVEKDK